jgi:hypothetical protein
MARGVHPIERVTQKLIELTDCDAIDWREEYMDFGQGFSLEFEDQIRSNFPGKCKITHGWFFYHFEFADNFYKQGWRKSVFKFDKLWKSIEWQQERKEHKKFKQGAGILHGIECSDERLPKKERTGGGGVPPF